jgi:hypothetical protein
MGVGDLNRNLGAIRVYRAASKRSSASLALAMSEKDGEPKSNRCQEADIQIATAINCRAGEQGSPPQDSRLQ